MGFLTLLGKNTVKLADIIPADKHNVQTPVAITLPFSKKNAKGGDGQLSFNAVLTAPPKPQTNPPVDNAQKPPATVAPAPSSSAQPPAGAGQPPPTTAQPASSSAQAAPAAAAGAGAGTGTGTGHSDNNTQRQHHLAKMVIISLLLQIANLVRPSPRRLLRRQLPLPLVRSPHPNPRQQQGILRLLNLAVVITTSRN
jgi:hypothetical protein